MKRLFYIIILLTVSPLSILGLDISFQRDYLTKNISKDELMEVLSKDNSWVHLPAYGDRDKWNSLPKTVRERLVLDGEKFINYDWPIVKATDYLEFTRSGDRSEMQRLGLAREKALQSLVLAELVEGKGRFINDLVNGVWALSEQTTWVLSAHLSSQKRGAGMPDYREPIIDLVSGRIAAAMSWTHYFFAEEFDKINPIISERIKYEVRNRILEPYYSRDNFWWMGFKGNFVNNWNVWCNYNVLQCIMLMEDEFESRVNGVYKVMSSIDKFINNYPNDGGCDEGPEYWQHAGGKMFEGLEVLKLVTNGRVDIFDKEVIKNIGRYIYRAYISDPYFVNFADASAKPKTVPSLIYRYGKTINDRTLKEFGAFLAKKRESDKIHHNMTLETIIRDIFDAEEIMSLEGKEPLISHCWLSDTEFATARERVGDKSGFFFAAKGGHNGESHNHNDVGSFIIYHNGLPLFVDAGLVTYTRQTFSKDRYKIWTMRSAYHNLPTINGFEQPVGNRFSASDAKFSNSKTKAEFSVNIQTAYPDLADVNYWLRTYTLNRERDFIIKDSYSLKNNKSNSSLNFLIACDVELVKPGVVHLKTTDTTFEMLYDKDLYEVIPETIALTDERLINVWGDNLMRLVFKMKSEKNKGSSRIRVRVLR